MVMGVIVNKFGERFVTEDSYHARTSGFVLEQPDSVAYLIVNESHMNEKQNYLVPLIDGWETIEEMERDLGIPEGKLRATMARYNENAAKKEDPDFHKAAEFLEPQDTGPWAAYDLSLGKAMYAGFTMGGMATSLDGEVLDEAGSVIKASTPRARAPPTSPRIARGGIAAEHNWVRARTSVDAPVATPLRRWPPALEPAAHS